MPGGGDFYHGLLDFSSAACERASHVKINVRCNSGVRT